MGQRRPGGVDTSRCWTWVQRALTPLAAASVFLLLTITALAPVSAATARPGGDGPHRLLTVMTQNMDEGTDFTPLFKSLLEGEIVADVSLWYLAAVWGRRAELLG